LQTLKARTLKTKSHLQTKIVFWLLFAGSRGGTCTGCKQYITEAMPLEVYEKKQPIFCPNCKTPISFEIIRIEGN